MLTRLSDGRYVDLSIMSAMHVRPVKKLGKGFGNGFQAVGISHVYGEIVLIDFCTSKEDCQTALDHLIASHQNTLVLGKTVTKEDVKIFLVNLPKSELKPFYDLILSRVKPKEDVDLWGDLSPLMGEAKDAK